MEHDVDEALDRANPYPSDPDSDVKQFTHRLAVSIAAVDHPARRRRRNVAIGFSLGVVLVAGSGASAIPTILECWRIGTASPFPLQHSC